MAWNEPGNGSRDPWGQRSPQQGPPDLDEVLRKLQQRLSSLFGSGGGAGGRGGGGGGLGRLLGGGGKGIGVIVAILAILWGVAGIYIVEPAELAVVQRFGRYIHTAGPGPHWAPYLIDSVSKVNVEQLRRTEIGYRSDAGGQSVPHESLMLTRDENIVDVGFAVLYRVKDAADYLFRVRDPETTLRQAAESAIREVVGRNTMDFVLTQGRTQVANEVRELTQQIVDRYETGLIVTSANMQSAQPPPQVQDAFSDAVKAREDEERVKNEARAFVADILPKAKGEADAIRERAQAYKERVTKLAEGDAARFLSVLRVYQEAPEITRERLYLDTMEAVLSQTSKVLLDVQGGNSLIYLPIDRLLGAERATILPKTSDETARSSSDSGAAFSPSARARSFDRARSR